MLKLSWPEAISDCMPQFDNSREPFGDRGRTASRWSWARRQIAVERYLKVLTMPLPADFGTFHTNPKRKRGKDLSPRLRFGLVSARIGSGIFSINRICPIFAQLLALCRQICLVRLHLMKAGEDGSALGLYGEISVGSGATSGDAACPRSRNEGRTISILQEHL